MVEIGENERSGEYGGWGQNIPTELQQLLSSYQRHMRPRIVLMKHDTLPICYFGRFCSIAIFNSSNWEYFSEFIISFGKSS